jgi:flagellar motor switch protein FliN
MTAPWLRKIEEAVEEANLIPLWGSFPSFPWDPFSLELSKILEIEGLEIKHQSTEWKKPAEFLEGAGADPLIIPIELAPVAGTAFWVMGREDISRVITYALSPQRKTKGISDPEYQEGFYRYLCLESLQILDRLKAFQDLSLKIKDAAPLPDQEAFCIDVSLKINQHSAWGRIICPKDFFHSFRTHFLHKKSSLFEQNLAQKVEVGVHCEIGNVTLRLDQWKRVKTGDLILLDRGSFDPKTGKGALTIVLENTPIFRARIKQNKVKILDYAFYNEENKIMGNDHSDEEEQEDQDENETENEEQDLENGDETLSEMEVDEDKEEPEHLWSTKNGGDGTLEKMISTHEIPISLTVEVARLRMTLDKVLQLQPGNMLELSVSPESGVDITAGGKKIAKGELVKLGEMLGVKILQIGE